MTDPAGTAGPTGSGSPVSDDEPPFLCLDRVVPLRLSTRSEQVAAQVRPDNRGRELEAVGQPARFWDNGRTLRVRFLDEPQMAGAVMAAAAVWSAAANLAFRLVADGPSDVRVTFHLGGNWSDVGTDALLAADDEPTMCLSSLLASDSSIGAVRAVRHEFGHVLGLVHEHSSPEAGIDWDRDAVVADLTGPEYGWTEEQVEMNVLRVYRWSQTRSTEFDPQSIMIYPIKPEWTLSRRSYPMNHELSKRDKAYVRDVYPRRRRGR